MEVFKSNEQLDSPLTKEEFRAQVLKEAQQIYGEGRKHDEGKTDWDLLPWAAVEEVVQVLMHGEQKYGRDNWKHVPDAKRRYFNAAIRHLLAYRGGEERDSESGRTHLAHAVCCLLFLMEGGK